MGVFFIPPLTIAITMVFFIFSGIYYTYPALDMLSVYPWGGLVTHNTNYAYHFVDQTAYI